MQETKLYKTHERLEQICKDSVEKKFGTMSDIILSKAKERMYDELQVVRENAYAKYYLQHYDLIQYNHIKKSQYNLRGCAASSLISYLLEISHVNPLDEKVPLYYEFFLGFHGNKQPHFDMNVDTSSWEKVIESARLLDSTKANTFDCHSVEYKLPKLDIKAHANCELNARLEEKIGYYPTDGDIHSKSITEFFDCLECTNLNMIKIVEALQPNTFEDIVKMKGISYSTGTWTDNGEVLFRNAIADINSLITCREDVFEKMLEHGFEKETAFTIAETVQNGMFGKENDISDLLLIMREHGVQEWYISSCQKIKYLFPRAHIAEYAQMELRSLYYKINYRK